MTEKQCPFCGEMNPENETTCWKCGSNLDYQEPAASNQEESKNPEELIDSFRKFDLDPVQSEEPEDSSSSFSEGETFSPEEDAFWLERMRELSVGDGEDAEDFDAPDQMDISDENIPPWLKAVDPTRKQEPAAEPGDEWGDLRFDTSSVEGSKFTVQSTAGEQEEEQVDTPEDLPEDELPGWLTRLTRSHEAPAEEKEEPAEEEMAPLSGNQGWLQDLVEEGEEEEEILDEGLTIPGEPQSFQDETAQGRDEEEDDFISSFFSEQGDSGEGIEDASPSGEEPESFTTGYAEFSDALTSAKTDEVVFSEEENTEVVEPVEEEAQPLEEDIDWLAEDQPVSLEAEEQAIPAAEDEMDEAAGELFPETPFVEDEEPRDWSEVMEGLDSTESTIEEELPNWVSLQKEVLGEEVEIHPDQPQAGEVEAEEEEHAPFAELEIPVEESIDAGSPTGEKPGTDGEIEAPSQAEKEPAAMPADELVTDMPFKGDDLLAWMHDLREEELKKAEGEGSGTEAASSGKEGIPDWFEEEGPVSREGPEKEEALERGDLPTWLSAIRPIEAVIPEKIRQLDEKKIEQIGPLAGLRAVIPAQEDAIQFSKPPVYSLRLQVSEKQRAHAAMLEDILDAEGQPAVEKKKRRVKPQYFLRLFIALVILAAAVLPYFGISAGSIPLSTGASSGLQAFSSSIDAIPQGGTVLVAVDFAPGYTGEMNLVAGGVLARLISRGVHIAVISTTPTGPALAEGLMDEALSRLPDSTAQYSQSDWYINLGYLPGETASLKEFAREPRQAVIYGMKAGLSNMLVWDTAGLTDIYRISDFAAVVLATESLENGRAWVEQVQPLMNDVPLLAASSAQSAPLLQPYVQSGQVQAILQGLPEGLLYGQQVQPSGSQGFAWSSYLNVLLIGILVMLLGGLIVGIISMFTRSKSGQEV